MHPVDYQITKLSLSKDRKQVLNQISCTIPSGSLSVVLGPNGGGKTSLLRCLVGLEKNYTGKIALLGKDLRLYSQAARTHTLSWCPAHVACAFSYSVWDVVCMGRFPKHAGYPTQRDYAIAEEALSQIGMHAFRNAAVHSLSSGEFRKVMIAQVLASQNPVLVFDEPDAHLDIACIFHTLALFKTLCRKGHTLCLSLHDLHLANAYADHVILLKQGRLLGEGKPATIFQENLIREAFGVEMRSVKTAQQELLSFHPPLENLSERIFGDK